MSKPALYREEIVPFVVRYVDRSGGNMVFVGDEVLDVEVTSVTTKTITFTARDVYGDATATAKVSLHLLTGLNSPEKIVDYLNDVVHDALAESHKRDGQAVIVAR